MLKDGYTLWIYGENTAESDDAAITIHTAKSLIGQEFDIDEVDKVRIASKVNLLMYKARPDANVGMAQEGSATLQTFTGKGVVVGIIDTGFEYAHADFYTPTT